MKSILLPFLLYSVCCYSQITIQGTVKDLKTNKALSYCAIAVKGINRGCITNIEGIYRISVKGERDTLLFSYIGYETRTIPVVALLQNADIFLKGKNFQLTEVTIHGDDDFIYEILNQCREKIRKSFRYHHVAKVYFGLETGTQNQPVEMLECYYNGHFKGVSIEKLFLKNGRVGLAEIDNRYFVSLSTSRAISYLNLTKQDGYFPFIPFQYNKSNLKKLYNVKLIYGDDNMFHIEFAPRKNDGKFFKGEVWIDKETYSILKINLLGENVSIHPFLPIFPDDSLYNVSLDITQTYIKQGGMSLLNHINFNYRFEYENLPIIRKIYSTQKELMTKEINATGVMYIYDYEDPFIQPYFEYDIDQDDYRKISFFPYNKSFWNTSNGLIYTEKQEQKLSFFEEDGVLLNFYKKNLEFPGTFFESNNIIWSDSKRLSLRQDITRNETLPKNTINQSFQSDLYNLKVQIFLDVNRVADSLQHYSATVFDVFKTYYQLPEEPYTNCFLNIYFDICEIERREMEGTLNSNSYTITQIDSVYQQTIENMDSKTKLYLKEVQSGKNTQELYKWNKYVLENLNIDNVSILGIKDD